jgi:hypothetical protein
LEKWKSSKEDKIMPCHYPKGLKPKTIGKEKVDKVTKKVQDIFVKKK